MAPKTPYGPSPRAGCRSYLLPWLDQSLPAIYFSPDQLKGTKV